MSRIDEYIRKVDAVDEINTNADDLEQNGGIPFAQGARAMAIVVGQMPSADVVPVVRCKDCKHYYFADNRIPQEQRYVCEISGEIWKPNSFCSYGERREE